MSKDEISLGTYEVVDAGDVPGQEGDKPTVILKSTGTSMDPTMHAEIQTKRSATKAFGKHLYREVELVARPVEEKP